MEEIAKTLKEVENPGSLMVGGVFIPMPRFRLRDVSFQMGFRRIDYDKIVDALADAAREGKTNPLIRGQFYVLRKDPQSDAEPGTIQTVTAYHKAPEPSRVCSEPINMQPLDLGLA